jgi:hypothetical protein
VPADGLRRLWQTVLIHGIKDALNGRDQDWLYSRDFSQVCRLAGFEPECMSDLIDSIPTRVLSKRLATHSIGQHTERRAA